MLHRRLLEMVPSFIPRQSRLAYLRRLRQEIFSQAPLAPLIRCMERTVSKTDLFDDITFPLVAPSYNWSVIQEIAGHILHTCDQPVSTQQELLVQAWEALPIYLSRYAQFYPNTSNLTWMHHLLVTPNRSPTWEQIHQASKLESGYFLSLDTGVILKNPEYLHTFNRWVSFSPTRLRAAIDVMHHSFWKLFDLDGIVEEIQNNAGPRYYNLTTDAMTSSRTRLPNVNHQYRVVAEADDTQLFQHVIALLDHAKLLRFIPAIIEAEEVLSEETVEEISSEEVLSESSSEEETAEEVLSESSSADDLSEELPPKKAPSRKVSIPAKVRQLTWRKYIGSSMDGACWCCGDPIAFENWHAGHVLAAVKGGKNSVQNLRPLCASCNLSMHDTHMADFIRNHDMQGKGALEFLAEDLTRLQI